MKVLLLAGKTEDKNSSYSLLTVTTKFFFPAVAQIDDSNYIRISFSITQSCLNIIDNYKMVQFFRNSVIGNYSAMLPRQKAVFHYKLFHCVRECLSWIFLSQKKPKKYMCVHRLLQTSIQVNFMVKCSKNFQPGIISIV